ncbi:MAG: hypothetical protein ACTSO7_08660 [Candidatus Heimdallarchaeota archaeon]
MTTQVFGFNEKILLANKYTNNKIEVMLRVEKSKVVAAKINGQVCGCNNFTKNLIESSWVDNASAITSLMPAYSYHLKSLMILSWEKMAQKTLEIPQQARFLRTMLFEFERIQNHLDFIIALARSVDYHLLKNRAYELKTKIDTILNNSDNILDICFGGVTRALSLKEQKTIKTHLHTFLLEFKKVKRNILKNAILVNQLKDVGLIARDEAKKLSLSGPIARGSGITIDLRKSDPYVAYKDVEFSIAVSDNCDLFGETKVRCNEIQESVNIIKQLLEKLPNESNKVDITNLEIPSSSLIHRLEAPNGELFLFSVSNKGTISNKIKRGNLVLPSKVNKLGFLARITSENFDNIPIILPTLGNGWE